MALSNWDSISWSENGQPSRGVFISPLGVKVELYKNWIYIGDEKAWYEGSYARPYVMEIYNAELCYKDVNILALHNEENEQYLVCWSGWEHNDTLKGMIGMSLYGYDEDGNYRGVESRHIQRLKEFMRQERSGLFDVPYQFREIIFNNGKRFNQGDMFFHDNIGVKRQCTEVGKAHEPILSQVLKNNIKSPIK